MAEHIIPERRYSTCDVCGVERTKATANYDARLTLKRDAIDYQGNACADASVKRDLCDACHDAIAAAVNMAISARMKETDRG